MEESRVEAMDQSTTSVPRPGALEIVAIVLLFLTPALTPLAWVIAVVLIWISEFWARSDKLFATLIPPLFIAFSYAYFSMWGMGAPDWLRVAMMFSMVLSGPVVAAFLVFRYRQLTDGAAGLPSATT